MGWTGRSSKGFQYFQQSRHTFITFSSSLHMLFIFKNLCAHTHRVEIILHAESHPPLLMNAHSIMVESVGFTQKDGDKCRGD